MSVATASHPLDVEADPILTEVRGRTLIVTINRPHAKNAMNYAGAVGIAEAMDRLDADDGLTVGILTGAGESFCAVGERDAGGD